ncbi:MAG: peptidoglycan-binding domain-containing protein, partial [Actinomycetota bacterium]
MRLVLRGLSVAMAIVLLATPTAIARTRSQDPSVTLAVSGHRITFGHEVRLSGEISPASSGQTVTITDSHARVVKTATTDDKGKYSVTVHPHHNLKVRTMWTTATSAPHRIAVMPIVHTSLGKVRLFHKATVRADIKPASEDSKVTFELVRSGHVVRSHSFKGDVSRETTKFKIPAPGTYVAKTIVKQPVLTRGIDRSRTRTASAPYLSTGSHGYYVKTLERRLIELGYYLPRADRSYDEKTYDAVIAFHKVQGQERK